MWCPLICSKNDLLIRLLLWRHNGHDGVSNHQPHACLLNRWFRHRWKKNIKAPRHWALWEKLTGEFPAQRSSNAENVSIGWRHHPWPTGRRKISPRFIYQEIMIECRNLSMASRVDYGKVFSLLSSTRVFDWSEMKLNWTHFVCCHISNKQYFNKSDLTLYI